MPLSIRHTAAIERGTSANIGISTRARKYWRQYWASKNMPNMLGDNSTINEIMAGDYSKAQPLHRFPLRSGEDAEIRLSHAFYYIGVIRSGGQHDIIAIQAAYREPPDEVRKRRLTEEWLRRKRKIK